MVYFTGCRCVVEFIGFFVDPPNYFLVSIQMLQGVTNGVSVAVCTRCMNVVSKI